MAIVSKKKGLKSDGKTLKKGCRWLKGGRISCKSTKSTKKRKRRKGMTASGRLKPGCRVVCKKTKKSTRKKGGKKTFVIVPKEKALRKSGKNKGQLKEGCKYTATGMTMCEKGVAKGISGARRRKKSRRRRR